jgi:hypothetical protein
MEAISSLQIFSNQVLNLQAQYINPSWIGSRVIDQYLEMWLIRIGFISFPYFEIGVQVWVSNYYYVGLNFQILPTSTHGLRLIPTDRYLELWFNNKGSITISIIDLSLTKSYMANAYLTI